MKRRILIVDDLPETCKTLSENLGIRHPDWTVDTAVDRMEAIAKLKKGIDDRLDYDVVVSDLWMNDELGGAKLVEEIASIDPHLIAIVYTGKLEMLDRYALLNAGAYDVIERNRPGMTFAQEIDIRVQTAIVQREKTRKLAMLSRFFDATLLNRVIENNDILPLSQRKVTVVFWDIRGFTVMCDTLKAYPSEIAAFLQEYCDIAAQVIFDHCGVLDKFIGDGVMAIFGACATPSDDGQVDAVAAVTAAQQLRIAFVALVERWLPRWKRKEPQQIDIGLGCGIHSGDMLVGTLGTELRHQFTAIGPHVNLTARIEGRAATGQILVSGSTRELGCAKVG